MFTLCSHSWKEQLRSFTTAPQSSVTPLSLFPKGFIPDLSSIVPVVGASPGPRFHFLDRDPGNERSAKRFRITGKSSADKRARVVTGDLPTPKRWQTLVPQGTGLFSEGGRPVAWTVSSPRGLAEELVRCQGTCRCRTRLLTLLATSSTTRGRRHAAT